MAKEKQNEKQNGQPEVKAEEKKSITKEQYLRFFSEYDAASVVYEKAVAAMLKAKAARSDIVKGLCEATGGKGPFKHPKTGLVVSGVERKNKETKESNWFFKGPGESDVIDVNSLG